MADYGDTLQLRNTIENIAVYQIDKKRPAPRYGVVAGTAGTVISPTATSVQVILNGETDPVAVVANTITPSKGTDVVRVEGRPGDRRIADVITPGAAQFNGASVRASVSVDTAVVTASSRVDTATVNATTQLVTNTINPTGSMSTYVPGSTTTYYIYVNNEARSAITPTAQYVWGNLYFRVVGGAGGNLATMTPNASGIDISAGGSTFALTANPTLTFTAGGTLDVYAGSLRKLAFNSTGAYFWGPLQLRVDGSNVTRGTIEVGQGGTILLTPTGGSYVRFSYATSSDSSSGPNAYLGAAGDLVRTSASSRRIKRNILDLEWTEEQFMQLRPIHYDSILPMDEGKHFVGFIAEEVADAGFEELVNYGEDGQTDSLNYDRFTAPIVKQLQEVTLRSNSHDARIRALEDLLLNK